MSKSSKKGIPSYNYTFPVSMPMTAQEIKEASENTWSVHTNKIIPQGTELTLGMLDPTGSGIKVHGIVQVNNNYYLHRTKGNKK